jgi:hypothetical protein
MSDGASEADVHIPSAPVADLRPITCKAPEEAPILQGDGSSKCEVMGADTTAAASEWPDASMAEAPVAYVKPGATGGTGTKDSPFGELAAAASARTIVLSRGTHTLSAPFKISKAQTIIGASANTDPTKGTVLSNGFLIEAANVSISRLAIVYAVCTATTVAIDVKSATDVKISDVVVSKAGDALRANASTVRATGFSALAGCSRGVALEAAAEVTLEKLLVRDGKQIGIAADGSRVVSNKGLIMLNGAVGVSLKGASSSPSKLDALAIQCNERTGLTVDGATAEGSLLNIADARGGGDGVIIRNGGKLTLDATITSDGDRGFGSQILINTRAGVVVSGKGSTLTMNGAIVASNMGPGVFVQDAASASVSYSRLRRNVGAGLAATGGSSIVAIQCNELEGTRAGTITTSAGALSLYGDALSFAEGSKADFVMRNDMSRNDGFAAVFVASTGNLTQNTGTCNGFPVAGYDGAKFAQDDPTLLPGNAPAPMSTPVVAKGSLSLP